MTQGGSETILKVAVPVPLPRLFDYLSRPGTPCPARGTRVLVPFGQRRLVGVVIAKTDRSELPLTRLVPVIRALDECKQLLNNEILDLLEWCWRYYKHPAGEVVINALPPVLRRPRGAVPELPLHYRLTAAGLARLAEGPGREPAQWEILKCMEAGPADAAGLRAQNSNWRRLVARVVGQDWVRTETAARPPLRAVPGPELTQEQAAAVASIDADRGRFRCHLLDGVTGSGKTEVYLRLTETVASAGRQVLVLVPEIGLTPQLIGRFRERLGIEPAVYHSGLADGERLRTWALARAGRVQVLLGTRSALFLPLPNAGLIIMDESHDASFKQQDGFRFAARDVAVKRAANLGIPIVLGTATPALETLHNAGAGRYQWHRLRQRATGAGQPGWRVVDLCAQSTTAGLTEPVIERMAATLERGEQVLVFLNRRGYAPVLLCHDCGWHGACQRCDANLTWHRAGRMLMCHHCGHSRAVPRHCPECSADALQGAGEGTQQLESFLAGRFRGRPVYRFDRDATLRKGEFEKMYHLVRSGQPAIMVGTQMLAKGHHFPRVTLVVVVNVDQALYSGDFRAMERMGQLLVQVAGRSGRADHPGQVVVQTHHPGHPLLERLFNSGYEGFAAELLEERRVAGLPPFSYQAMLRAEATDRHAVQAFLESARRRFRSAHCRIHGPYPAQMERRGGRLRWYLLVQGERRPELQADLDRWLPAISALPAARRVRWALDVDPQEF